MDTAAPLAPPVVAVVVVHEPGEWFDQVLTGLARQDYPNLNALFLITGPTDADGGDLEARIRATLPDAFVRPLAANRGYGAAANEVAQLVEGGSGFFCFLHDDVALDHDAIRVMVEELYRSNAGVVGPKLVDWDHPGRLQHVGLGMDRFGEIDPVIEPDEADQEQHDAVRDVFVLPSACLLVRADLFRSIGGFDEGISFHGDDVELCWRVHLSGARVVVVPQARARHREQLEARRPDLNQCALRARHRLRAVATLTSRGRLAVRSLELVALSVVELVVGLFTGRFGEAWSSLRALVGLAPRTPALIARRRAVRDMRRVPDQELVALHSKGSARISSYLRSRQTTTYVGEETSVRRWRESSLAPTMVGLVVVLGLLVASRTMINTRVPPVGEMLPLPASAGDLWADFTSGWNPNGLGSSTAAPTGWGVLAVLSVLWAGRMGLGLTVLVVGAIAVGLVGMWRLATLFPQNRARVLALVVYAAVPLVPGLVSTGRLGALFGYAVLPWFVHLLRRALGIGTADPALVDDDLVDGILEPSPRDRLRRTAVLTLASAVAVALAPPLLVVLTMVVVVFAASSLAAGAGVRTTLWSLASGLGAVVGAWILNLPASATWSWSDLVGVELLDPPGRGLTAVASMDIGRARFPVAAVALYVPVLVALAVARSWRLTWAARAAGLVAVFGVLAVLQDRDALPRLPDVGYLLVPVAVGLALGAASLAAAFGDDVGGRSFGWRQPAGIVALLATAFGCVPVVATLTDGAFFAPRSVVQELAASYAGTDVDAAGAGADGRVLYLGDPRLLPVPGTPIGGGVAMAVVDDGPLDLRDRWPADDGELRSTLATVLGDIAAGQTARGGRLLAPFGVRFIVVPIVDEISSTTEDPLPVATGLLGALDAQLDLSRFVTPPSFVVYENTAVMPTIATTTGALAEATRSDTLDVLVGVDTAAAEPVFVGADTTRAGTGDVPAGTVHVGIAPDDAWQLIVDGTAVEPRPAFGATSAYDVTEGGSAELRYEGGGGRRALLVVIGILWLLVVLAASRLGVPAVLRRGRTRDETLLDLDAEPGAADLSEVDLPAGDRTGFGGWVDQQEAVGPGEPAALDFGTSTLTEARDGALEEADEDEIWDVGRRDDAVDETDLEAAAHDGDAVPTDEDAERGTS